MRGKLMCEWFARCDNEPEGFVSHPVLSLVPTCAPCARRMDLDLLVPTITDRPAVEGDLTLADGAYALVIGVHDYAAGEHDGKRVHSDLPAREWVTLNGSRWSGIREDGTPFCAPAAYELVSTR